MTQTNVTSPNQNQNKSPGNTSQKPLGPDLPQQKNQTGTEATSIRPVGEWVAEINQAIGYCTGWAVKTGQLLIQAKQELGYGSWMTFFDPPQLNFGLRTAELLMEIARQPVFCNAQNFANLPAAWSVLHVLRKLPPETLQEWLRTGKIHPDLTLADARQLVVQSKANAASSGRARAGTAFESQRQAAALSQYLCNVSSRWPREYHETLADLLEATARELRSHLTTL